AAEREIVRLPRPMIPLTELEADILGDMAWDSHLVGEIIGFVRSANPLADDFSVYRLTYSLLESWIDRGWLQLAPKPHNCEGLSTIRGLLPYFERHGVDVVSTECIVDLPEIDLTDQAFLDVEWLRGAV
ncbi:MAG: hypothetical protein ACREOJ_00010, partial [Gemmatimonadaceae bacterium]